MAYDYEIFEITPDEPTTHVAFGDLVQQLLKSEDPHALEMTWRFAGIDRDYIDAAVDRANQLRKRLY